MSQEKLYAKQEARRIATRVCDMIEEYGCVREDSVAAAIEQQIEHIWQDGYKRGYERAFVKRPVGPNAVSPVV